MTTSTQTQLRRGTSSQVAAMTPATGEVVVNTTNKRPHLGDGSTVGGIVIPSVQDIQQQFPVYATVGGTADAITLTNSPAVASYAAPLKQVFKATGTNTTAVTANVDGLGTKNIKKMLDGALASLTAGDIVSGGIYEINYDGTQFQIKGLGTATPASQYLTLIQAQTAVAAASIDFTTGISSSYAHYILELSNMISSSNSDQLNIRFKQGGSFITSSVYYTSGILHKTNTGTLTSLASNGTASIPVAGILGNNSVNPSSARIHFFRPDLTENLSVIFEGSGYFGGTGGNQGGFNGAALVGNSAATTGIQVYCTGGNISATAKLYGVT